MSHAQSIYLGCAFFFAQLKGKEMDPSTKDQAPDTTAATGSSGAEPGKGRETFDEAALKSEVDRRVNEAHKKWKEQLDATVADKTRDAESKLAELTGKAAEAERYASFIEGVSGAGVRNVKAAYLVAKHGDYFDKKGAVELDRFKKDNPEFFAPLANANAGAGAGQTNNGGGMNAFIRAAAGR